MNRNANTTRKPKLWEEMLPFAFNFLKERYNIIGTPPIYISQYLQSCLAEVGTNEVADPEGNKQYNFEILVSNRLIKYYTFEEQLEVIYHELIHYALMIQGRDYRDGSPEFENELKKHNILSTETLPLRGKVHTWKCNCNPNIPITMHYPLKKLPKELVNCPLCNNKMEYVGIDIIEKPEVN